jgi:two-component system, chemotaxis family, protein-glutamate methylesterase/glutaminase
MYGAIIIGGSAGSFKIISQVITSLPVDFPIPVIVCVHRLRNVKTGIIAALSNNSSIKITEPSDKDSIEPGTVYIAPANYHLLIEHGNYFSLATSKPVNHSRPSIDIAMKSAAGAYSGSLAGILISGANSDGAEGMMAIHQSGGTTIVQDPNEAEIPSMPEAAIDSYQPDYVYNTDKIINFIGKLTSS